MRRIRKWLVGSDRNISRRNIIWNMLGSTFYAFATLLLTTVTGNVAGESAGGVFSFAFAIGQQLLSVSYFGVRPYHQTDVAGRYAFQEYFHVRIATCLFSAAAGIVYLLVSDFTAAKAAVVFLLICFKMADGFADVYEIEFQRQDRLYMAGKSMFFRTLLSVTAYIVALLLTRSLIPACAAAVLAAAAGVVIFDMVPGGFFRYIRRPDWRKGFMLLRECVLIFLASFMEYYILNASKFAIEAHVNDSAVYCYTVIFLPNMVINLVAGYIIRPFLTGMVVKWERRQRRRFAAGIFKIFAIITAFAALAQILGYTLGTPVLNLISGADVSSYRSALLLLVAGGSLYAGETLLYYVLVIFRRQKSLFVLYGIVFLAALAVTGPFVRTHGIMGGAAAYFLMMALLFLLFGGYAAFCFAADFRNQKRKSNR